FGDVSFFSFGRDKIISSVFGGIVATNNLALAEKITKLQNNLTYPNHGWIYRQLAHPLVLYFVKKTYNVLYLGKFLVTLLKQLGLISRAVSLAERQGAKPVFIVRKMSNALAVLALHQLKKIARFNEHRQKIAALYNRELTDLPGVRLPQLRPDNIYLRYTICTDKAKFLIKQAKKQGIELGCWYDCPVAPKDTNLDKVFYTLGSCPKAEKLAKQSVNLPTNIQTSEKDALRVIKVVKDIFSVGV
ncbi:MAG: DegT/DnrJ/EryC1/StrS family aminotransferase, partial [Patescibacteria group bacterium]